MTTAVSSKPASPAPSPAKTIFQGLVKIHTIEVREHVRKKFDKNAHEELVSSVKAKGVISPITVRPGKSGGRPYILVAGERRLRAALGAGLEQVPVVVRDLDDQSAALYQVEENIHRKDLTPIEEARGFKLLLDAKKFTVEQLAQLVDKSMPYVYRAVHLLDLPKKAVDAIEEGTLTPAHGVQLLRVPANEREAWTKELLEDGYDGRIDTAIELREKVEQELGCDLAGAKFAKDKPYAGAIACTACPNNSGNQGVLFDGAEKGTCTLKPCFDKKTKQHWDDVVAKLEELGAHVLMAPHSLFENQYISGRNVGKEISRSQIKKGQTIALSKYDGKIYSTIEKKQTRRSSSAADNKDYERERFIDEAGRAAFYTAYMEKAKTRKFGKSDLVDLVLDAAQSWNYLSGFVLKAWGWKKFEKATLEKLTESQLIGLLFVLEKHDDRDPKAIGLNVADEIKKAKEQAAKDYDAKKGAEKKK